MKRRWLAPAVLAGALLLVVIGVLVNQRFTGTGTPTSGGVPSTAASASGSAGRSEVALRVESSGLFLAFDSGGRAVQSATPAMVEISPARGAQQIEDAASGKCLVADSPDHGSHPMLAECSAASRWTVNQTIALSGADELVLDVFGNSKAEGASVIVWTQTGMPNQHWTAVKGEDLPEARPLPAQQGGAMPTTTKPGFTFIGGTDFTTDAPEGNVASNVMENRGGVYDNYIVAYPDEWEGNHGGRYRFSRAARVHSGMLDVRVGLADGTPSGAAWIWKHPDNPAVPHGFVYGAVEQRVRVVGDLAGYGSASLLWPDSDVWDEGEIDFPEGDFGKSGAAYHHCVGDPSRNCSVFQTNAKWTDWHTYRIEWTPNGTSYYIDGRLIGKNTNSTPTEPMHWVTQIALHKKNARVGNRSGQYQVAWAKFERLTER